MTESLCRICRQGTSEGALCHPCRCSGSIRFVHQACLDRWLSRKQTTHCELCGAEFRYVKNIVSSAPKVLPLREFSGYLWEYYRRGRSHILRLLFVNFAWGLLLPISVAFGCRFLLYGLYPPSPFFVHVLDLPKSICLGLLVAIGGVIVFLLQSFIHAAISEVFRVFLWWRQRSTLTSVAAEAASTIDVTSLSTPDLGPGVSSTAQTAANSSLTALEVPQEQAMRQEEGCETPLEPLNRELISRGADEAVEETEARSDSSETGEVASHIERHSSPLMSGTLLEASLELPAEEDSRLKVNSIATESAQGIPSSQHETNDVSPLIVATGDEHSDPSERISISLRFPLHRESPPRLSSNSSSTRDMSVPSEQVQIQTIPSQPQRVRGMSLDDATVDENGADAELLMWAGLAGPPHRSLICIGFVWLGSMLFLLIFLLLPYKMGETLLYHDISRAISMHTDLKKAVPLGLTHLKSTLRHQLLYECTERKEDAQNLLFNLSSATCPEAGQDPSEPYVLTSPVEWTEFHLSSGRSVSAWIQFVSRFQTDVMAHILRRYRPPLASVAWTRVTLAPYVMESLNLLDVNDQYTPPSSYTPFKTPWMTFYAQQDLSVKVARLPTISIDLQDPIGLNWFTTWLRTLGLADEPITSWEIPRDSAITDQDLLVPKIHELEAISPPMPPTLHDDVADAHWYATARQPLRPWRRHPFVSDSATVPSHTLVPSTARNLIKRPSVAVLGQGLVQLVLVGDTFGCSVPYWILGRLVLKDMDSQTKDFSRTLRLLANPYRTLAQSQEQPAQLSYQIKIVLAPLPSPSTSLKWVLIAWWAGLMGQAQVVKAGFIGSILALALMCLVLPSRARLGDLSLRQRWANRNAILRTIAKWIYLLLDLTHFALSFLEIGYKIFVVLFCKVAVPLCVGFCLIRLGSVSPWLGLDSRWVSFHIHSNAHIVILFAHLLGWIHAFTVASVTLRVLDTLDLTVTEKIIMHDKITLSFFTFNFAVLASLTDIKQMLLSSSRDSSDRTTDDTEDHEQNLDYPLTEFVWQVTDVPLEDLNDDLISKIYRLMGAYFSTASWNDFLEGLLVFLFIHVLVAALSAWATATVVQIIAPQFLPFQMMPTVSSPQALQRPWFSAFIRILLSAKYLIWDFDLEASRRIMPFTALFLRWLILTACVIFWCKCILWLEPPPRLHALTPLTLLALRIGGFADYIKPELKAEYPLATDLVNVEGSDEESIRSESDRRASVASSMTIEGPIIPCVVRSAAHLPLPSNWRRRELAFVICKEVEALFISNDDLVALDYKQDGRSHKYDCVPNVDRSQFVVSGVFVASRVETVNSSGETNEEDIMFKVYMPSIEVPNASLSNIRFAASKIFVVQDTCICRSREAGEEVKEIKFPLKARGFFMGDGDGTHYTFRYVAVQAPSETIKPIPIWKPLPGTWKYPCCPAILLCTAVTIVVCCVLTFPLAIGRFLFCVLNRKKWTMTTEAVGPIIVQSFASLTPIESTIHHGLAAIPSEIMNIPIPTTEHTDLVTYALGCLTLFCCTRVASELLTETSWTSVLYSYIMRHPGGWKCKLIHVARLVAFALGVIMVLAIIPCIQGAVLDLTVLRPDITALNHPLHLREARALVQCHVQWFLIGIVPSAAWLFLLYFTHFGMWIHPTPYIGSAVVATDVLQELSATVLEFRWTSRGVAADRRKIKLLYGSVLAPLLQDLSIIVLRPVLIAMIMHTLINRYNITLYSWLMGILIRPVGALIAGKFVGRAVSQAWKEITTLHSTLWQNRYVISTILCNSESNDETILD